MELFDIFLQILLIPLGIVYELVDKHGWQRLLFLIPFLFALPVFVYILYLMRI